MAPTIMRSGGQIGTPGGQQVAPSSAGGPGGQQAPAATATPAATTPTTSSAPSLNLQPSYATPSYSDVNFDPNSFMSTLNNYLQPQFGQQDAALTDSLADAGIVGGSTAGAMGNLANQQQLTEQGDAQSALMSLLGLNLNQSEFNAGEGTQSGEFNASAFNANEDQLAGYQNQDYLTQMGLNE